MFFVNTVKTLTIFKKKILTEHAAVIHVYIEASPAVVFATLEVLGVVALSVGVAVPLCLQAGMGASLAAFPSHIAG